MNRRVILFILIPLAYLVNELIPHGNTAEPSTLSTNTHDEYRSRLSHTTWLEEFIKEEDPDLLEMGYDLCWNYFSMLEVEKNTDAFPITIYLKPKIKVSLARFLPLWKPVSFKITYDYSWGLAAFADTYLLNASSSGDFTFSGKATFIGLMSGRAIKNKLILLAEEELYTIVSEKVRESIDDELEDVLTALEKE
ncbi:MAG: hypothetical protein AAFY71_08495 [Bacteroidota bacterium]